MKSLFIFLILGITSLHGHELYSQDKININVEKVTYEEFFTQLQQQTDYIFFYKDGILPETDRITLMKKFPNLEELLEAIFRDKNLTYIIKGRQVIILHEETVRKKQANFQGFKVSGIVVDGNGVPLPGATVLENGTANGTQTDFDGNYTLTLTDKDATIVISYIGMATQVVPIQGRSEIDIVLKEDAAALDEVVLVGYGTQKKSDLTGAISSLKDEDLNPGANASVDQMMLGRASGVQISQSSSAPGGGLSIRIRGASSLNASNQPLYVIDGFPIDNSENQSSGGAALISANYAPRNPLNSLNPNDIESIEILKDASATAIYGSRGANGVIIITTKKGKEGRMTITYDAYAGIQSVSKKLDVLSPSEYIDAINTLSLEQGNDMVFDETDILNIGAGTDWQEEIFRDAPITNNTLSISGGTNNTTLYTSFNYFNQLGVVENSGLKRYTGRFNLESKIKDKIVFGVNFNTSLIKDNNNIDGVNYNENAGPINSAILYDPTEPIYNEDGEFNESANLTINNPVSLLKGVTSLNETNRTFGTAFLQYNFLDDLYGRFNFGTDRQTSRRDIYNSSKTLRGRAAGGIANINILEKSNYLFEYTMNYNKTFNQNHVISLLGGVTYQKFNNRFFSGTINGFLTDLIETNNFGLGDTNTDILSSGKEENTLLSYLGRINYNLFDKFLVTASLRADGSSRFGENNRFGYFPSFAVGYKLSEEEFIPELFNQLKLRGSWGQTGNQEIGNYRSQLTFGTGPAAILDGNIETTVKPLRIANPNLKWETSEQLNIGLDFGILKNRINGTIDYYHKTTKDLLFNLPLPLASGYSSILTNVGEIQNSGFEFLLNTNNIVTDNFHWETTLNFSTMKNKVIDLGRVDRIVTGAIELTGNTAIIKEGSPLAAYYGYVVTGIFQEDDDIENSAQPNAQPGYPIFQDRNRDGAITPEDQTIIGSPFPDFTYGISNSFSFKDFRIDIFFQGQEGAELLNANNIESLYPANFRRNRLAEHIRDRWTPENTDAAYPSGIKPSSYGGGIVNTLAIEDASYLRLKNLQLSYNMPVQNIDFLNQLKIYLTGQNIFTITNYTGFDPEANAFGRSNVRVDYSSYPLARVFMLGLTAEF